MTKKLWLQFSRIEDFFSLMFPKIGSTVVFHMDAYCDAHDASINTNNTKHSTENTKTKPLKLSHIHDKYLA